MCDTCREDAYRQIHVSQIEELLEMFLHYLGGEHYALTSNVATMLRGC